MTRMQHLSLHCPYIGAAVTVLEGNDGAGVRAWVYITENTRLVLLADSAENKGVSATNGYTAYADAVCRAMRKVPYAFSDLHWFELDSIGRFDAVTFKSGVVGFGPLIEGQHKPSSKDAFLAHVWKLAPASIEYWHMALNQLGINTEVQA